MASSLPAAGTGLDCLQALPFFAMFSSSPPSYTPTSPSSVRRLGTVSTARAKSLASLNTTDFTPSNKVDVDKALLKGETKAETEKKRAKEEKKEAKEEKKEEKKRAKEEKTEGKEEKKKEKKRAKEAKKEGKKRERERERERVKEEKKREREAKAAAKRAKKANAPIVGDNYRTSGYYCAHGAGRRKKGDCRHCGTGYCEHNRKKGDCRDCGTGQCEHGRRKSSAAATAARAATASTTARRHGAQTAIGNRQ
jgi:hypothetical protein